MIFTLAKDYTGGDTISVPDGYWQQLVAGHILQHEGLELRTFFLVVETPLDPLVRITPLNRCMIAGDEIGEVGISKPGRIIEIKWNQVQFINEQLGDVIDRYETEIDEAQG